MRRFLVLIATLAILLSVAAPASAGRRWTAGSVGIQTDNRAACEDFSEGNDLVGHTNSSPNYSRSGVKATIDLSTGFSLCTSPAGNDGNVNAFVNIYERAQTNTAVNHLRLGIVECRETTPGEQFANVCQGENNPVYYAGYGGGLYPLDHYTVINLGAASYAAHEFAIYLNSDQRWYFSIDGSVRFSIAKTDPAIRNWADPLNNLLGAYWGFKIREDGDSIGDPSNASYFSAARYGRYNLGWFNPLWTYGAACQYQQGDANVCSFTAQDGLKGYSR